MANSNQPTILEVDAATGEQAIRPMTAEEIAELPAPKTEEEIAAL
jgi:hypothetical protein